MSVRKTIPLSGFGLAMVGLDELDWTLSYLQKLVAAQRNGRIPDLKLAYLTYEEVYDDMDEGPPSGNPAAGEVHAA